MLGFDFRRVSEETEAVRAELMLRGVVALDTGPAKPGLARVLLDGDLGDRLVIDALTGEVLSHVRASLDA